MWSPTHMQVLVKRGRGLKIKGKNDSNDAFVTIGLGKEKFQTSVVEKSTASVEWMEQCELVIPTKGNTAEIVLTALHRNFIGVDEFLGRLSLPLSQFDHHEKPVSRWYPLTCKPGQSKADYRGDLEVRVSFTVNAKEQVGGSVSDLSKKKKGSNSSLNKVTGSLMNLGDKPKNIKKLAASVGHKIDKVGGKAKKSLSSLKLNKDKRGLESLPEEKPWGSPDLGEGNLDPGVNSDDDGGDEIFKKVSASSLSLSHTSSDSLARNSLGRRSVKERSSLTEPSSLATSSPVPPEKPKRDRESLPGKNTAVNKKEGTKDDSLSLDVLNKFNGKTREDLIEMVVDLHTTVETQAKKIKDLEDYIDNIVTRVIEVAPTVLQKERLDTLKIGTNNNRFNKKQIFSLDWNRSKFG